MKALKVLSFLLVMALVSQISYAQCCKKGTSSSSSSSSTSSMSEAKFSAKLLSEPVIKTALAKVEGVNSYNVDAKAGSLTVNFDSKKTDCEKIKSALNTSGVEAVNCESKCTKGTGSKDCSKDKKS